ncbi:MAG: N-acetylmuramoyl-L-alanine amidase [Frankia sp.]|nr:N-acetylmuramoyl-L-alanine amidase [Frankia sp.]
MKLLRLGDRGPAVAEARAALAHLSFLPTAPRKSEEASTGPTGGSPSAGAAESADVFDPAMDRAVRAFQQSRGLSADGIIGPDTARALEEARHQLGDRLLYHAAGHPLVGDDVAALQERLSNMGFDVGRADGIFGPRTEAAVRDFQRNRGLEPDGRCGPVTLRELQRLQRTVTGGRPDVLRESVRLLARGPSLLGMLVAIDPGHGGDDPGVVAHGLTERDVVADLADRLENRLRSSGLRTMRVHESDEAPDDAERARRANAAGADLFISLHVDGNPSPRAEGVACYYFGNARGSSAVGERLALLVQKELVSRTGMLDCRTHPKTWELLRRTTMPAVRIEVGYLTNPRDAAALASSEVRAEVAEAVLTAIQRLYLPPEQDPPTGQLRVPRVATPSS